MRRLIAFVFVLAVLVTPVAMASQVAAAEVTYEPSQEAGYTDFLGEGFTCYGGCTVTHVREGIYTLSGADLYAIFSGIEFHSFRYEDGVLKEVEIGFVGQDGVHLTSGDYITILYWIPESMAGTV